MGLNSLSNLPYNYYPRIKEERYVLQSLQCRKGDFEQIILDKLLSLNNGSKASFAIVRLKGGDKVLLISKSNLS